MHTASLFFKVKHQGHCCGHSWTGNRQLQSLVGQCGPPASMSLQKVKDTGLSHQETLTVLPNDNIRMGKKNLEFWKTCTDHQEPGSFSLLQDVSEEVTGYTNKGRVFLDFIFYIMKYVNIWNV